MLLLAVALVATTLLVRALAARPARMSIGGAALPEQSIELRRRSSLLLLNTDLRPHQVFQLDGPPLSLEAARLARPGSALELRFPRRGTYTLETVAGPCFVPRLEHEVKREHALLHIVVS